MKQNSTKSLKWLTGVVGFFGLFTVICLIIETLGFFFDIPVRQKIVWIDDMEIMQTSIAILRLLGGIVLFCSIIVFMIKSINALNKGVLFPRVNIKLLFIAAGSAFVFLFCQSNIDMVLGKSVLHLQVDEILVPAVICIFAIIYRVAVQVSEENSLTI